MMMKKRASMFVLFFMMLHLLKAEEIVNVPVNNEEVNDLVDSLNPLLRKDTHSKTDSLLANTLQFSKNVSFVPEIVLGDLSKAKLKVTIYSAPTCTHCAEYHKDAMSAILELTKKRSLVLVMRTFIANLPWDLVAGKITWVFGEEKQFEIMESLLKDQNIWLIPSAYNRHNDAERKAYIEKLDKALDDVQSILSIKKEDIKERLDIKDDDVTGLLKVYALKNLGIPFEKLEAILHDKDLECHLLRMTLNAKDEHGKLLNFTPAIYVQKHPKNDKDQGYLQKDNLTADQIEKLLDEAEKEAHIA
jgi:hypothetical protein